jgi:hypothetical protein
MGKAIDFRLDSRLLPRGEKILVRIAAEASDCASAITADQANFRRQCWRWRRPSPATRWPGQKHNPRHTAEGFTSTAHPHDTVNNASGIDRVCNSCIFLLNLWPRSSPRGLSFCVRRQPQISLYPEYYQLVMLPIGYAGEAGRRFDARGIARPGGQEFIHSHPISHP